MLPKGALRTVGRANRWRLVVIFSNLPHRTVRPLATSCAACASPRGTPARETPGTLLPRQAQHLPPPKAQSWITEVLKHKPATENRRSTPPADVEALVPARSQLLNNAQNRRSTFQEEHWDNLVTLRAQRSRVGNTKTAIEAQMKQLHNTIAEKVKREKGIAANRGRKGDAKVAAADEPPGGCPSSSTASLEDHAAVDMTTLKETMLAYKAKLSLILEEFEGLSRQIDHLVRSLPNRTHPRTPIGSERCATVKSCYLGAAATTLSPGMMAAFRAAEDGSRQGSQPTSLIDWATTEQVGNRYAGGQWGPLAGKDHVLLASSVSPVDALDLAAGRLAAGPNFPYLLGPLALLEQALLRFTAAYAIAEGFHLVSPPILVKTDIAERCGFNPRGGEGGQTYFVSSSSASPSTAKDLCLVGTAEVALAALVAGRTFSSSQLPRKLLAISPAFRAEDGGRGAHTKGLYRLHQFQKAEMYVVCAADKVHRVSGASPSDGPAEEELKNLVAIQETVMQSLGLTYRRLDMPTEELGDSAYRKFDIEAWMPGRGTWGEVSSASNCTDYQSSRLHILQDDVLNEESSRTEKGHAQTLNATLCATPRMIISLLEQYGVDEESLRLRLPKTLQPHWIGDHSQVQWVEPGSDTWTAEQTSSGADEAHVQKDALHDSTSGTTHSSALSNGAQIASQKRHFSSSNRSQSSLYDQLRSRLSELSLRSGTDAASLSASFLILHEMTAVAPLFLLFYLFGLFGIGETICAWFIQAAASTSESEEASKSFWHWDWRGKIGQWINEASVRTERYARHKGCWGFRKGSDAEVAGAGEGERQSRSSTEAQGTDMAGAFANAIAAYVVTKALLVPRLFLSFYLSPPFARSIFEPVKKLYKASKAAAGGTKKLK